VCRHPIIGISVDIFFLAIAGEKKCHRQPHDYLFRRQPDVWDGRQTGASRGMDYPSQLSEMIGKPVINAGVPGDTTARALRRLESDVLTKSPDLVLITLGGNDLKNGVAREQAFENLHKIVESIQSAGAKVIIGGLSFPFRDRGFGKAYRQLAEDTGAELISNIFEGIMGNRDLMSDPIHPNDKGYKIIAERFHEALSH